MPLKYGLGIPSVNMGLGAAHGVLTVAFCLILAIVWIQKTLTTQWCLAVFVLSIIPFGAFIAEKKLKELSNK
jgi:integral membrane protein